MFSRRITSRAYRFVPLARPSRQFTTVRARLLKEEKVIQAEVPVVAYSSDAASPQHDVVKVNQLKPVSSAVEDVAQKAIPLKSEILSHLSPTLKKFTLEGKVALVTGYLMLYTSAFVRLLTST
jgi:hypothetical protein